MTPLSPGRARGKGSARGTVRALPPHKKMVHLRGHPAARTMRIAASALLLVGSASAFLTPPLMLGRGAGVLTSSSSSGIAGVRWRAARSRAAARCHGAVQLRASAEDESRKYKIGDAVEAEWIGDSSLYAGTIEGYFTEGRYDVKWADPQGMADTQPTPEENIIPFEPAKFYRYGLGAWEAGDLRTAYLCMRTIYICVGEFAKTEQYLKSLMQEPEVQLAMAERNDKSPFADRQSAKERFADGTNTVQRVGDEVTEAQDGAAQGFYDDQEIEELRGQAREQNLYQNMWLQYNQANKMQVGKWCGVWEDYSLSKGVLVKQQDRKETHDFQTGLDVEGLPEFTIEKDKGKLVSGFYPMAAANWFVDKAYTTAELTGDDEAKTLQMEIGLRHENLRASCTFVYSNGVGGSTYALEEIRVGRQKLDEFPDGSESILFGDLMGVVDASQQLSGPADQESSNTPSNTEIESNVVSLCLKGGLAASAPKVINSEEINREVTMCWETPAVAGIAWDGMDRVIPALHYRASRIFKGASDNIEMLSITESRPSEGA